MSFLDERGGEGFLRIGEDEARIGAAPASRRVDEGAGRYDIMPRAKETLASEVEAWGGKMRGQVEQISDRLHEVCGNYEKTPEERQEVERLLDSLTEIFLSSHANRLMNALSSPSYREELTQHSSLPKEFFQGLGRQWKDIGDRLLKIARIAQSRRDSFPLLGQNIQMTNV